jgi:hypothetical protein
MLSKPTIAKNVNKVAEVIAIRADWLAVLISSDRPGLPMPCVIDRPHTNANDDQQAGHPDTGENEMLSLIDSPTPRKV